MTGQIESLNLSQTPSFEEGFDPDSPPEGRLSGLSLFSGGGSFDRGLDEGGAIQTRWAVEIEPIPMHTYKANMPHADTKLYMGSVNDYFAEACSSEFASPLIARVGQVGFLNAGSPCKGFSLANTHKNSEKALGYASLVGR